MSIAKEAEWQASSPSGSSTSLVVTITSTVPVGNHLKVTGGVNATDRTLTVTDSKGNVYETHKNFTRATGTPATSLALASCKVTTQLVNGDTVTLTWSGAAAGGRTGKVVRYSGGKQTGSWFARATAGGGNATSVANSTVDGMTTEQPGELLVALVLLEGNLTFSGVLSGWTNESGVASGTTIRTLDWASKIKAAAGAEPNFTATHTAAITSNFMAAFLPEPDAPPPDDVPEHSLTLLGAG